MCKEILLSHNCNDLDRLVRYYIIWILDLSVKIFGDSKSVFRLVQFHDGWIENIMYSDLEAR